MTEQSNSFGPTWAIVDVMGHQRYAGLVTERTIAGHGMLQIDVPEIEQPARYGEPARLIPAYTKIIAPASIHSLTPCTEAVARAVATRSITVPITTVDLARPLPALPARGETADGDEDDGNPF